MRGTSVESRPVFSHPLLLLRLCIFLSSSCPTQKKILPLFLSFSFFALKGQRSKLRNFADVSLISMLTTSSFKGSFFLFSSSSTQEILSAFGKSSAGATHFKSSLFSLTLRLLHDDQETERILIPGKNDGNDWLSLFFK